MAEAEQTGNTSGQTPLPLWVTIGDQELADENPDPEEGAFIGEYPSDDALQGAVDEEDPLRDYILAAIEEVRRGAAPSTETTSPHEGGAKTGNTSGQTPLPLWVTIGDRDLADANPDPEEGAYIGEYSSDGALQGAVDEREQSLRDCMLAAIEEVRRGAAPSTETTSPHEGGAKDAS